MSIKKVKKSKEKQPKPEVEELFDFFPCEYCDNCGIQGGCPECGKQPEQVDFSANEPEDWIDF